MIQHKENLLVKFLKWIGIIKEYEVNKAEMCKEAQDICDHKCENCAWNELRGTL